jgi:hypothetical protein
MWRCITICLSGALNNTVQVPAVLLLRAQELSLDPATPSAPLPDMVLTCGVHPH